MKKKIILRSLNFKLLLPVVLLLLVGVVMVASASFAIAQLEYGGTFFFLSRHIIYLTLGITLATLVYLTPLYVWLEIHKSLLLFAVFLLIVVLIPGIGLTLNGARRWLGAAGFTLQVSELAKLFVTIYMAAYVSRYQKLLSTSAKSFIMPSCILAVIAGLLLLEPDFGAVVVIMVTALGILFLGGLQLRHFVIMFTVAILLLLFVAVISPYRLQRLTTFLDPWSDEFNTGYQLTQALIAFGRGGWFGVGLGSSIQKLFYLPEAHTDFMFAVIAEELGMVGLLVVMGLFYWFCIQGFKIAGLAYKKNNLFAAYLAYGLVIWQCIQIFISIGVNIGILPTKGLTMPFISYGGSSLIVTCMAVGLLLRISREVS